MACTYKQFTCARCGLMKPLLSPPFSSSFGQSLPEGWRELASLETGVKNTYCRVCVINLTLKHNGYDKFNKEDKEMIKYDHLVTRINELEQLLNRIEADATAEKGVNEDFDMIVDEFSGKVMTDDSIITVTFYDLNMETGLARKINIESTKKPQLKPEDKNLMYDTTRPHTLWSYEDIFGEDDEDMPT